MTTRSNPRGPRGPADPPGSVDTRAARITRRLDADQDPTLQLMMDEGLANLLVEKLARLHGSGLALTTRAALRSVVRRLTRNNLAPLGS